MTSRRGFTLLEVMMAIAILGLGLTVLLGAQTGLFASATRAEHISVATGLARCRMSELELDLLQKGFPLIDQESEGDCCMGELSDGYDCAWKVLTVELPEPPEMSEEMDAGGGLDSEGTGPLAALLSLEKSGGQAIGETQDISALATQMSGAMGGGEGIASTLMSMVYPTLKPMLEASIRKVVVSVRWREGVKQRTLDVTQYVTDPQQAALASEEARGALNALPGMVGNAFGDAPTGTSGTQTNPGSAAGRSRTGGEP